MNKHSASYCPPFCWPNTAGSYGVREPREYSLSLRAQNGVEKRKELKWKNKPRIISTSQLHLSALYFAAPILFFFFLFSILDSLSGKITWCPLVRHSEFARTLLYARSCFSNGVCIVVGRIGHEFNLKPKGVSAVILILARDLTSLSVDHSHFQDHCASHVIRSVISGKRTLQA